MKVTLAYPWTDDTGTAHQPDATVDVSNDTGAQLLRDGRARKPDADTDDTDTSKEA